MALSREDLDYTEKSFRKLWEYRVQLASLDLKALRSAMREVAGTYRLEDMNPYYRVLTERMIEGIVDDYSEITLSNIEELHESIRSAREGSNDEE